MAKLIYVDQSGNSTSQLTCGSHSGDLSSNITLKLVRNANSMGHPRPTETTTGSPQPVLISLQGHAEAHFSLRTTAEGVTDS